MREATITIDDVVRCEPCGDYDRAEIERIHRESGLPERSTAVQIIDALRDVLPHGDLVWLLAETGVVPNNTLAEWSKIAAIRAVRETLPPALRHAGFHDRAKRCADARMLEDALDATGGVLKDDVGTTIYNAIDSAGAAVAAAMDARADAACGISIGIVGLYAGSAVVEAVEAADFVVTSTEPEKRRQLDELRAMCSRGRLSSRPRSMRF